MIVDGRGFTSSSVERARLRSALWPDDLSGVLRGRCLSAR
jgi:hypothetical protein